MNAVTIAGVVSTVLFLGSNLPMVLHAIKTRDVSSYSRVNLLMVNSGNAIYTIYVLSLPAGPIWLLHLVYTAVSAFMLAVHVWWSRSEAPAELDDDDVVVAAFTMHPIRVSA